MTALATNTDKLTVGITFDSDGKAWIVLGTDLGECRLKPKSAMFIADQLRAAASFVIGGFTGNNAEGELVELREMDEQSNWKKATV